MNDHGKLELVVDNTEERPQLKLDGKGPQQPPGYDWLSKLSVGDEFFCRDKSGQFAPRFLVLEYIHGGKLAGHVWLIPKKTMNDVSTWNWVVPEDYCKSFEFRGHIPEMNEDPENGHDGNKNTEPD